MDTKKVKDRERESARKSHRVKKRMRVRKCTRVHKIGVWRVFTSGHDTLGYLYTLIMGVISIQPNYSQTNRNVQNTHTQTHSFIYTERENEKENKQNT